MMSSTTITVATTINGTAHRIEVNTDETLASLLRDRLGLTGLKVSCGLQICGACTVLLDDRSVSACTILAAEADGSTIRTVEGLGVDGLSTLQTAFIRCGAFQCGYCTPGLLMTATELLEQVARPTEDEIRHRLSGNICRCTGYRSIVAAVREAALQGGK